MNRSVFAILAFALVTPLCHAQVAAPPAPAMTAAPAPATPATTATAASDLWAAPPKPMPKEIHWVRNSAEYRAAVLQAYRGAAKELDSKSAELTSGTWAVVLDADETVIDNSQFQKELAEKGARYSSAAWKAWCLRGEATAIPGAIGFIKHVRDLGGKVVIITNRSVDVQVEREGSPQRCREERHRGGRRPPAEHRHVGR
jgi:5'-nucleotidase (lipoprotein e(P4) family)